MKIYFIVTFIFCLNHCVSKKYCKYRLFRGVPVNQSHLEFFKNLGDQFDVNYWTFPGVMNMPIDFVVSPEKQPAFLLEAQRRGVYLTTILEDVQKVFDLQTVKSYVRRNMDSFDWHNYFRLNDIYQWLRDLEKEYPEVMELQIIGKTFENRDIMAVKILHNGINASSKVIIEGGIHAREWISPAFVTYLISQILHAVETDDEALKNIATIYEWYFIPVLNPDGYEYTHTEDRLWRKNRFNGHGIDLNRNFAAAFGTVGTSYNAQSETYCGKEPFSENEAKALAEFVRSKSKDLKYYLSFHSYGQYMLIPYEYKKTHDDNFDEMKEMCDEAATHIATKYGTEYIAGTAFDTLGYLASGVSTGWVKRAFHVP